MGFVYSIEEEQTQEGNVGWGIELSQIISFATTSRKLDFRSFGAGFTLKFQLSELIHLRTQLDYQCHYSRQLFPETGNVAYARRDNIGLSVLGYIQKSLTGTNSIGGGIGLYGSYIPSSFMKEPGGAGVSFMDQTIPYRINILAEFVYSFLIPNDLGKGDFFVRLGVPILQEYKSYAFMDLNRRTWGLQTGFRWMWSRKHKEPEQPKSIVPQTRFHKVEPLVEEESKPPQLASQPSEPPKVVPEVTQEAEPEVVTQEVKADSYIPPVSEQEPSVATIEPVVDEPEMELTLRSLEEEIPMVTEPTFEGLQYLDWDKQKLIFHLDQENPVTLTFQSFIGDRKEEIQVTFSKNQPTFEYIWSIVPESTETISWVWSAESTQWDKREAHILPGFEVLDQFDFTQEKQSLKFKYPHKMDLESVCCDLTRALTTRGHGLLQDGTMLDIYFFSDAIDTSFLDTFKSIRATILSKLQESFATQNLSISIYPVFTLDYDELTIIIHTPEADKGSLVAQEEQQL